MSVLTILILFPAIAALAVALLPRSAARLAAQAAAWLTFFFSLAVLLPAGVQKPPFYQLYGADWFPGFFGFTVGVDGVSALLVVMTTFLSGMAMLWPSQAAAGRERAYFASLLLLEATTIGAFCALDLILFYVFFEACLLPVYFLIGLWGGPKRLRAAMKFFVYTVIGSLLMLAAILYLFLHAHTFHLLELRAVLAEHPLTGAAPVLCFLGFAAAFAVKTPLFPFHTWQADTYAETPIAGLVLLAGAMAKLGTYGFYRFGFGLFPDAAAVCGPFVVWLATAGIVYGALVAARQRDALRLIAYSSLSHLGFVVLGLFSQTPVGSSGAVLQMVNHGITTGGLLLLLGMLQERRGTLQLRQLGGLWEQMPRLSRLFLILALSSVALPLTNGFVGEFLILLGSYQKFPVATILATSGVIWSAVYMLSMVQRAFYGPVARPENRRLTDLGQMEMAVMLPFIALVFLLGIYPSLALRRVDEALEQNLLTAPARAQLPAGARTALGRREAVERSLRSGETSARRMP